jgi:hypothetical protein
MQFMPIGSIKLVYMVVYKYQCQYGPNDLTNVAKYVTQNHIVTLKKLDINGKGIPSNTSHKETWNSSKKMGWFYKEMM